MTQLILVRHGHVDWIAPERYRGRADLPLTEEGVRQARATSRRIEASWRPDAVYTSPMSRGVHTGRIIAEPWGLAVQATPALNDIDYGEWQGLTRDEARARWPEEVELWYRAPHLARIPGGESLQDVLARAARGLRAIVDRHVAKTVVLVGHDSVNRVILLHALDLPLSGYWRLAQSPCALNRLDALEDGFRVHSVNETWHLEAPWGRDPHGTRQGETTAPSRA
jgi:broad specificity phosphatase PhoE